MRKIHIKTPATTTTTTILRPSWILSGTIRVSRYQKGKNQEGKTNLDLLDQEIVSGSGIRCTLKVASKTFIVQLK